MPTIKAPRCCMCPPSILAKRPWKALPDETEKSR
jgi:hypothetical protein